MNLLIFFEDDIFFRKGENWHKVGLGLTDAVAKNLVGKREKGRGLVFCWAAEQPNWAKAAWAVSESEQSREGRKATARTRCSTDGGDWRDRACARER